MKLSCEIVQDLLPLYEENLCSTESRTAVEEHLQECTKCRSMLQNVEKLELNEEVPVQADTEAKAVAGSFRKVRRRWRVSLIAMLLVVPTLILSINQFRRAGICFTNLDDIFVAWKYVHALENGDYEKLASYMHYENLHQHIKELVIAEPDVNGSNYSTQMLEEDRAWVVTASFYEEYLQWEEDIKNFWGSVICNYVPGIMIPETIWAEITSWEPETVTETADGEILLGNRIYVPLETKWGNFIVEQGSSLLQCSTAVEFCNILDAVPAEIYKEAYPELEKQAWEDYYYRQEHFAEAAAMSLEEFSEIVKARYITGLENCEEQGITFANTGYRSSYYTEGDGYWQIEFGLRVTYAEGSFPVGVTLSIRDGKVQNVGSMRYSYKAKGVEDVIDSVHRALYMRYSEY